MEDYEKEVIEYLMSAFLLKTQERRVSYSELRADVHKMIERYPDLRKDILTSLRDTLIDSRLELTPLIQVGAFTDEYEKLGYLLEDVNELIKSPSLNVEQSESETYQNTTSIDSSSVIEAELSKSETPVNSEIIAGSKTDFRNYNKLHDLLVDNDLIESNTHFNEVLNSKVEDVEKKTIWKSSIRNLIVLIGALFSKTHGQLHKGETIDLIARRTFKKPGNVEFGARSLQDASRQADYFLKNPMSRSSQVNRIYNIIEQADLRDD